MKKLKILNGYAGLGGNSQKWDTDKYDITAIEMNSKIAKVYRDNNPEHTVIEGDIIEHLLKHFDEYDIIWLSPPCQSHTKMVKFSRHRVKKMPDMELYQVIIFLRHFFKGKWVVENVKPYYDYLIEPTKIIGRHVFWSNFKITEFKTEQIKNFINKGTSEGVKELKQWLNIHYEKNIYYDGNHCPAQVLRNCVHPNVGESIMKDIENSYNKKDGKLF